MTLRGLGEKLQGTLVVLAAVVVLAYAAWVVYDFRQRTTVEPTTAASSLHAGTHDRTAESAEGSSPTRPASLKPFRTAVAVASDLLVIGDSTGDEAGEWVSLWAQDIARVQDRAVTLQQWDPVAGQFTSFQYGSGRPLRIWNLSYRVEQPDYATKFGEVPEKPAAVLLNLGHDRTPAELDATIGSIEKGLRKRWGRIPTAWILQNPSVGDAAAAQKKAVDHLRDRAVREQVPVVDVHRAFVKAGDLSSLLVDGARPNEAGSRVWKDAVESALHP